MLDYKKKILLFKPHSQQYFVNTSPSKYIP